MIRSQIILNHKPKLIDYSRMNENYTKFYAHLPHAPRFFWNVMECDIVTLITKQRKINRAIERSWKSSIRNESGFYAIIGH